MKRKIQYRIYSLGLFFDDYPPALRCRRRGKSCLSAFGLPSLALRLFLPNTEEQSRSSFESSTLSARVDAERCSEALVVISYCTRKEGTAALYHIWSCRVGSDILAEDSGTEFGC